MNLDALLDALRLGEDEGLEFKTAEVGLPKSLWGTVSAFSSTEGGTLVLGVVHGDGRSEQIGLELRTLGRWAPNIWGRGPNIRVRTFRRRSPQPPPAHRFEVTIRPYPGPAPACARLCNRIWRLYCV